MKPKELLKPGCWALVSTAFVAIVMAGGAERPAVRTLDLFYARLVATVGVKLVVLMGYQ